MTGQFLNLNSSFTDPEFSEISEMPTPHTGSGSTHRHVNIVTSSTRDHLHSPP